MKSSHVSVVWMSQSSFGLLQLLHHTFITVVPGNFITQGQICYSLLLHVYHYSIVFSVSLLFFFFSETPLLFRASMQAKRKDSFLV